VIHERPPPARLMVVREMMLRRERMGAAGGRGDGWRSRRGGRDNASGRTGRHEAVTYPLKLLHDLMVRRVLESHVVATDDTPMPMLSPGQRQDRDGEDVGVGSAAPPLTSATSATPTTSST